MYPDARFSSFGEVHGAGPADRRSFASTARGEDGQMCHSKRSVILQKEQRARLCPSSLTPERFIIRIIGDAARSSMVVHFSSAQLLNFPKNGHQTFGLGSVFGASRDSPALQCQSAGIATVAPLL